MFGFSKDAAIHIHDLLDAQKEFLGINYVGFGNERLLGKYPSVVVTPDPLDRSVVATHQFAVILNVSIWVYHAKLTEGHKIRTMEDIKLAEEVTKALHADYTLGGNVVFGFVDGETPGAVARLVQGKAQAVIGTRLTWTAESRQTFQEAQ